MTELTSGEFVHRDNALGRVTRRVGSSFHMAFDSVKPTTCVIYNVATTDAAWTAVAVGLTGCQAWKLNEREGKDFRYCFDGVGATYMTSLGNSIEEDTEITAIYVQRTGDTNINMELEVWSS